MGNCLEGGKIPRIRREVPLLDDAVLIRGGGMPKESTCAAVEAAFIKYQIYGISVFHLPNKSVEEVYLELPLLHGPYKLVRTVTAGVLRSNGYEIIATGAKNHYTINVMSPMEFPEYLKFSGLFSAPIVFRIR